MEDRNLALELVRVTEAAALSCARWMGRGDAKGADQAAVDAMRRAFDGVRVRGTVVIGEGERDEAPMLYIGEKVGAGWPGHVDAHGGNNEEFAPRVDIAVDPLEGTNLCATGSPGALEGVLAAAARRCLGGDMQGKLKYRNDGERARAEKMGVKDHDKVYRVDELAQGNVMFAGTGVTEGSFLKGVRFFANGATTQS